MKLIFYRCSSWKKPHSHQWPNQHRGQPQSFQENKGRPRITSLQIENSGQVTQRKRLILNGCKKNHIVEITWSFAGAHQWAPVICHCYTSQLKSVFWLEENVSRVVGQNSLFPCGEQNSLTPKGNINIFFQFSTRPRPNRANPRWRPHYEFRLFRPSNRLRAG